MSRYADRAEYVARKPSEQLVLLLNLGKLRPPAPLSASVTDTGATSDTLSGYQVRAMPMRGKAPALAAVTLWANTGADLVKATALGAGRDEPASAALVAGEDLVAVGLKEAATSPYIVEGWFGGGWLRVMR